MNKHKTVPLTSGEGSFLEPCRATEPWATHMFIKAWTPGHIVVIHVPAHAHTHTHTHTPRQKEERCVTSK